MLPEEWTAFPADLPILYAILCAHTRERYLCCGGHAGSPARFQAAVQAGRCGNGLQGDGSEHAGGMQSTATAHREVRAQASCHHEEQQARVDGLVRACTAMQVLLGDTYHHEIKCQALCSSWGGQCSRPACRVCPAAALRLQHPAQAGAEASVCWWLPRVLACLLAFPFRQALCQTGCKAESSFLELRLPSPPPNMLPRHLRHSHHQFTAGPSAPAGMLQRQRPSQLDRI